MHCYQNCLLNLYKIYYSVLREVHTKKKSFTYIFQLLLQNVLSLLNLFQISSSSDCDDDVSGSADFTISS